MIEIPESKCLMNQLNNVLKGRTIKKAIAMQNPHKFVFTHGSSSAYPQMLEGQTFTRAESHGSWVRMKFEDVDFLVSEGTRLFYTDDSKRVPKKHQMLITFDDDSYLCATVQMYGGLACAQTGTFDNEYYLLGILKPSVLEQDFDREYFNSLISDEKVKNKSVKAFLATEQRIPGLGNGVLQDILFNAGLNPKRKVSELDKEEKENLFNAIKSTILEMIENGGRNTETDLFGELCGYETKMSKKTVGKSCKVCGKFIKKENYMGGSIYYCPSCQPYNE